MASSDVDQKFLGRLAKATRDSNPLLSSSLFQLLGLSVLLSRKLFRARKLRKLDTSRDTKSLALYQHILWISREGLSILELYVLPYAQDNQQGPECQVLSVKLRASFYHIFCLFHNQPPVSSLPTFDARAAEVPPLPQPLSPRQGNGQSRRDPASPFTARRGKQPALREPIESITSETSFLTNPYAAGGPVGTPSPHPPAPPGLNPIPIPQPSSFILPPLNFLPLAAAHFKTAQDYANVRLHGSHPLRLSVALEYAAFMWDCQHDHDGARRLARKAIKDVYRAQEGMDDAEFEDAAELVGVLGRMMKRKSWEGTPHVGSGVGSPVGAPGLGVGGNGSSAQPNMWAPQQQQSPTRTKKTDNSGGIMTSPSAQRRNSAGSRSGSGGHRSSGSGGSKETTPRAGAPQRTSAGSGSRSGGSKETTPRARHVSVESGGSTTPRALQGVGRSPITPASARSAQAPGSGGSKDHTRAKSALLRL
ncbi:14-3-3 protein [Lophium mytilinum]|uniref:14-3-3 protein n=1 Tax=Lophium mytilinum TaxID=390894 RepID=A0A6A6QU21_9PEZI|nr:14-3-3 protein [Lophium mytilinum]